jgi:excisionase family DNA binding protein
MRLIQVGGAARRLECSAGWVRYLADTGRLPSCRTTTGLRLFKEEDLREFARKRQQRALPPTARRAKRPGVRDAASLPAEVPGCLDPHP